MYSKLFNRILFSSVWVEPYATRLVWVTFLAAMDEDGVVHLATARNVAALAQVTPEEAEHALATLEAPDPASSNPDNEGRRIERFPGGWVVLNAKLYRDIATRDQARQRTAERVRKHRIRTASNTPVTPGNTPVTPQKRSGNGAVTLSEAYTEAETKNDRSSDDDRLARDFERLYAVFPRRRARQAAYKAFRALKPSPALVETLIAAVRRQAATEEWQRENGRFVPYCATWLRGRRWEDDAGAGAVAAGATPSAADVDRARTVALVKAREALLRGDQPAETAEKMPLRGDTAGDEW